ncbi:hypothetical protein B5M09_001129 [Aphanomyces astaci]|uniref:Uncharacterized protein n=1 Tax=Aphanomyces astaci TaxID=112090 RepID=A0A3R7XPJ7_APHAT|nr:hypothetical protein B5M09_001129 [Aphanomyces astaci]
MTSFAQGLWVLQGMMWVNLLHVVENTAIPLLKVTTGAVPNHSSETKRSDDDAGAIHVDISTLPITDPWPAIPMKFGEGYAIDHYVYVGLWTFQPCRKRPKHENECMGPNLLHARL